MALNWDRNFNADSRYSSDPEGRALAIMVHAQAAFYWATLDTRIRIDIRYTDYQPNLSIRPNGAGLSTVRDTNRRDVNTNTYLTTLSDGGVIGVAYLRAVCNGNTNFRSNINTMFYNTDSQNGYVSVFYVFWIRIQRFLFYFSKLIAHELGHNLGMNHDFASNDVNTPRTGSDGSNCLVPRTNIMDYVNSRSTWSQCSNDDLNAYYNFLESRGGFCLNEDTG